jgi:hypothetical protein
MPYDDEIDRGDLNAFDQSNHYDYHHGNVPAYQPPQYNMFDDINRNHIDEISYPTNNEF